MTSRAKKKRAGMHPDSTPSLPTVGPSGSPVVKTSLRVIGHNQIVHVAFPPSPPQRFVTEWDGDDFETERELTDAEFNAWAERYPKALAEWNRTGGMHVVAGPREYRLVVTCANGSESEAVGNDMAWQWLETGETVETKGNA